MTVTLGALKPAHLLYPAMHKCGRLVLGEIGIGAETSWHEIAPPSLGRSIPEGTDPIAGWCHALAGRHARRYRTRG